MSSRSYRTSPAAIWRGPVRESRLPDTAAARAGVWILAVVGFVWLLTPRLYGAFTAHLHKEDGHVFLRDQQTGGSLLATYTGYLHVAPRLATEACAVLPPGAMTFCMAAGSSLLRVGVLMLLVLVLTPYMRRPAWALGAGALAVFGGVGQQEVLGNLTNLRWFLDVAATLALLGVFRRGWSITLATTLLLLGTLTDPLALLLAPVALWRFMAVPGRAKIVPGLYFPAALLHLLLLDRTARESTLAQLFEVPLTYVQNIVVRSGSETILGETGTTAALNVMGPAVVTLATLAGFCVVIVVGAPRLDAQQRWMCLLLGAAGVLFLVATLNFSDPRDVDVALGVARASRYALIPSILLGAVLLLLVSEFPRRGWAKVLGGAILAAMVVGAIVDSRGDEWATRGPTWTETVARAEVACSSGATTVTVDATPQGVPKEWSTDLSCDWVARQR